MKKTIVFLFGIIATVGGSGLATNFYNYNLANETGLAQNQTYVINVATTPNTQTGMAAVSAQIIYGSMTATTASFTGGQTSTMTITVANNAGLKGAAATNTITVPATSWILAQGATAQITISSTTPGMTVTINGQPLREGIEWARDVNYSSMSATSLKNAMNNYLAANLSAATTGWTTIWATATVKGVGGNSYTLISSSPTKISTTTWSGGRAGVLQNSAITFNGIAYPNDYLWTDNSGLSSATAASIAYMMNNFGVIQATASGSVIYATATTMGVAGNAFTLSATGSLVVGSANFSGGQDTATLTINGVVLRAGAQGVGSFAVGTSSGITAENISSAIVNTPSLAAIVTSTNTGAGTVRAGVVNTTSTVIGTGVNYAVTSSTPFALSITNTGYFGGKNSAYALNSAVINIPSHGFSTGFQVYESSGTGVKVTPLAWGTTYFAIVVDQNNIALATSLANAIAGSSITITSTSTLTTAPTFTLTPLAIGGTVTWKWQVSNDGTNYVDLTTPATYTIGSYVFPSTSTVVDFGAVNYSFLRLNVTAPTSGGLKLKVPVNGKL